METARDDGDTSPRAASRGACLCPAAERRKRWKPQSASETNDAEGASHAPEAVQFEVEDVRFFAQLLSVVIPHSAGGVPPVSIFDGAGDSGRNRNASGRAASGQEGDWNCVFVQWKERELRLRGVSRGRDVYSDLRLASSFFPAFEYKPRRPGRGRDERGKKRRTDSDRDAEPSDTESEEHQVMIRVHELINALMLFGENAHIRVRYVFDEGLLTILLHERPVARGASVDDEEEAISEICVKTFSVSQHERLPDLCAFSPSCSSSSADYLRMSPQAFREILVDLLGADEDAAAGSGDVRLSVYPPPLPNVPFPEEGERDVPQQENRGSGNIEGREPTAVPTSSVHERKPRTSHQSVAQEVALGLDPVLFPRLQLSRPHAHTYKLRSLLSVVPALKLATGLRLEWHEDGLLLLQLLIKPQLQTRLFLHFYLFATVTQPQN
uniref:Uncharacterized protein n=1 Tax=Neospora caninum (strain Liverpool) TaxID=572307 RepID=A0A0F7U548_NEOCL|nr:TPA: hypothetical protein BN1204_007570 [Neospora caninum Liverpool]